MSALAERMFLMEPAPTIVVIDKANKMQAEGKTICVLAAGEPDSDTPDHIKEAAVKAINEVKQNVLCVDGTRELKDAIIKKLKRDNI